MLLLSSFLYYLRNVHRSLFSGKTMMSSPHHIALSFWCMVCHWYWLVKDSTASINWLGTHTFFLDLYICTKMILLIFLNNIPMCWICLPVQYVTCSLNCLNFIVHMLCYDGVLCTRGVMHCTKYVIFVIFLWFTNYKYTSIWCIVQEDLCMDTTPEH